MKGLIRHLVAGMAISGLVACGSTQVVPQDQFYRLADTAAATQYAAPPLNDTLAVAPFQATSIYHDRAIVYAEAERPLELHQHHYHFWTDAPPRLLQNRLEAYLRAANVAPRVDKARASLASRYQVEGMLQQFEQRIDNGSTQVVVAMRLELMDMMSADKLLVKDYKVVTEPVAKGDVYAAVESFQVAVDDIFGQWVAALSEL